MQLPSRPSPSAIEVTSEDDPLTLEWPPAPGSVGRAWTLLRCGALGAVAAALAACAFWRALGVFLLCWLLLLRLGMARWGRRSFPPARELGQARLVLQEDALIFVPGGGTIPQVYAKTEVLGIDSRPRKLMLLVEEGGQRRTVRLSGRFASGDLAWLAELLKRWLAEGA